MSEEACLNISPELNAALDNLEPYHKPRSSVDCLKSLLQDKDYVGSSPKLSSTAVATTSRDNFVFVSSSSHPTPLNELSEPDAQSLESVLN
eukprot:Awhi_evm1s4843